MKRNALLLAATVVLLTAARARAATVDDLQKQIDTLNGQVKSLQESGKQVESSAGEGGLRNIWNKTRFGGYGELDYVFRKENGNGNGGNTLEPRRVVLYIDSELTDWLTFNTELEWEHGGVPDGGPDGGVSVEQAFLDTKLSRAVNVKAGVMLVPVGAVNLYHEPTSFNSTNRPELDQIIIPSTWQEMGAGIHGELGERVNYQLLAMTGLDGRKFAAESGIREGRQDFGKDSNRNFAIAGRLEARPITNLYTNVSFYSANSAPSGSRTAYTTVAAVDGKYSIGDFDIAGEYAHVYQDNPAVLSDEIGHNMSGYWVEGAYHVIPKGLKKGKLADADLVLFARWSELDTQQGSIADPSKASGRFDRNYTTFGLAFKPTTTMVVKADYQFFGDKRSAGETALDNDKFQITLGFVY